MKRYLDTIGAINYALFCLLILVLPLPWRFANYVLVAWLVAWALELRWCYRAKENVTKKRQWLPFALLALLVLWEAASISWSIDPEATGKLVERHLVWLALPIVAIFGVNDRYEPRKLLSLWVKTALLSIVLYGFATAVLTCGWDYYHDALQTGFQWNISMFVDFTGAFKHHLFYCMILLLGLCALPYLYHAYDRYPRWTRIVTLGVAAAGMIFAILLTNSRASWLPLLLLPIVYVGYVLRGKKRWGLMGIMSIAAIGVSVLLMHFAPRFNEMKTDPRMEEWSTFLNHRSELSWLGNGGGTTEEKMVDYYIQDGSTFTEGIEKHYGTHNEYLNEWMTLGPVAMLLVIGIFVAIAWSFNGQAHWWALSIAIIGLLNMLSEDLLERLDPVMTLSTALVIACALSASEHRSSVRPG